MKLVRRDESTSDMLRPTMRLHPHARSLRARSISLAKRPGAAALLALAALGLAGCMPRGAPGFSLARYARANSGEQVRLVGAISAVYGRETQPATEGGTENEVLVAPFAETGGSYRLHELYGATVTASAGMLTVEGALRFGDSSASLAIIHGVGGGLHSFGDITFQLQLVGGLFAQLGIDNQNFILVGGRYVFDDLYGNAPPGQEQRGQHYMTGGIGWLGQLFSFFGVGLEVHGGIIARVDGGPSSWFILPTATLNAAF